MKRKKSSGAAYFIPLILLLIGNEAISLFALICIVSAILASIYKEAERRGV